MRLALLTSTALLVVMYFYQKHRKEHHLLYQSVDPFDYIGAGGPGGECRIPVCH